MNILWYKKPARDWNEALPVGNGRLGAMVFGNTGHEVIQLNEESVWSGPFHDRNNYSARENLPRIRELIRQGQVQEAQELAYQCLTGTPSQQPVYQTAGELRIDFFTADTKGIVGPFPWDNPVFGSCLTYRRELDLETAVATTTFSAESGTPSTAYFARNSSENFITYTREVFASAVTDVIAVHISASVPGSVSFRAGFDRGEWATKSYSLSDDTICMEDTHGIPFAAVATVVSDGGKISSRGGCLVVEVADEATIYIDIQTAFRNRRYARKKGSVRTKPDSLSLWCRDRALRNVCFATGAPFPVNKENHIAEYTPWFSSASLSLRTGEDDADYAHDSKVPTDELLAGNPESRALSELYWNFSRYLLISCSRRPGTLPATLQGLWNKDMTPPWGCKYTININTQMNYWPASMCSLGQTELPLFALLSRAYRNGRKTARLMYGCTGFVAHHNLDIWGDTAPQDKWIPGTYWVLGAAWLCTHIREHYEYTQDKKFLRQHYYLLREASRFFVDYLVQDDSGNLVVFPSVSPENTYRLPGGQTGSLSRGCDMDNRILEHLFHATIDSARDLGISANDDDIVHIKAALAHIEPPVVTSGNTIREWPMDCEETEPGHRHMSHLYGLFPGHSIHVTRSPLLAKAAHNTIEKRLENGGGHTGWSQAWIMNFRASLHESDAAYGSLVSLFSKSTLPNLFDNHPPFQIDGNFGALCAMTRMVVQSEIVSGAVECELLPALPSQWGTGSLSGVSLKGNLRADIAWQDGALRSARIYAKEGSAHIDSVVICYKEKRYDAHLDAGSLNVMNVLPTTV